MKMTRSIRTDAEIMNYDMFIDNNNEDIYKWRMENSSGESLTVATA